MGKVAEWSISAASVALITAGDTAKRVCLMGAAAAVVEVVVRLTADADEETTAEESTKFDAEFMTSSDIC